MWVFLFFVMFFGLLPRMPIFLVLGACAAVLFFSPPAADRHDAGRDRFAQFVDLDVVAAVRHGGGLHRQGGVARRWSISARRGSAACAARSALVTVVACTLFAAICGSSVATALAMGTILLPAMIEKGYPRSFALGVIGASGTIGIVIPPSLALILYGIVAEQSVPRLFLAGILPGLLQATAFFAWVWYTARRNNFPVEPTLPMAERWRVTGRAMPALMAPVIVLTGIYGGFVTVTEAAAIAAAASMVISLVFYKGFKWTQSLSVIADALKSAGTIMLIVATAIAFGHWMTDSGVPPSS